MPHFLDLADIPARDLRAILDDAHAMKAARADLPKGQTDPAPALTGHTLAMVFEKNSTRTRFSFDMAMRQLGGASITATADQMQLGRGELVADTARVLGGYVDAIMARVNRHETLVEMAAHAGVPVINGLSDYNHPCQILADLMTLEEAGMDLPGARLAWLGDGNNVATSFVNAAGAMGYALVLSSPEGYHVPSQIVAAARAAGAKIEVVDDPKAAVVGADAVITDCHVSMGDRDAETRLQALAPWQVTDGVMAGAAPGAHFLHCLPAHRGEEVAAAVIDGPQSLIFAEAENRLHAQKAVLKWALDR